MPELIEVVLVDIGNTQIKSSEAKDGKLGESRTWDHFDILSDAYAPSIPFMACSTRSELPANDRVRVLSHTTPLPIKLDYETPETLGTDRIAAAVGAFDLFPNTNTLVIDLGTCITMDLVTKDGVFKGGAISPGLTMRMKAMAQQTANLPDISDQWSEIRLSSLGRTTRECLLAGSYGGIAKEIKGAINDLSKDFTSINVILTGGDAQHFETNLKAHIFAGSKIVLAGLHRIWKSLK